MVFLINRSPPYEKMRTKIKVEKETKEKKCNAKKSDEKPKKEEDEKMEVDEGKEKKDEPETIPGIEEDQRSENKIQLNELRVHVPPG